MTKSCLLVSNFAFIFLYYLLPLFLLPWKIWRSSAVRHIASGLLLCSFCVGQAELSNKVAHQKYLMYIECAKRVAENVPVIPTRSLPLYSVCCWLTKPGSIRFVYTYHMKTVALSHTFLCISISWQVFRLMAAVWVEYFVRFIKSQRLLWAAHVIRMDTTRTVKKTDWMVTMFIKTSRKTKTEMAWASRRGFKEDESEKMERKV